MAQLVQKNESDDTLRRLYFYLVDAADGITAETGEAAGQPQISVDGAAFTNTGIGTLTHMGNGQYYGIVTQATVNVNSALIVGRYKSANTAEAPSLNSLQVVEWDPQASPKTTTDAIGAFTGTGVNTILGFFKALFSKTATLPSDVGGTFTPSTDSTEAVRDWVVGLGGAGFNTSTHSLVAIEQITREEITPVTNTGISLSEYQAPGGFLDSIINTARQTTDEPTVNAKYTDQQMVGLIRDAWGQLWNDLRLTVDSPIVVRQDITVVANQQIYHLPAIVGEVLRLLKVNADTGLAEWEVYPRSTLNAAGPGFTIEGNVLRFTPIWGAGETLRIEYIPSSEVYPHSATIPFTLVQTAEKIRFPDPNDSSSEIFGSIDLRDNAYAGYMIRVYGETTQRTATERVIESYNKNTREATLSVPLDVAPAEGATYEVFPVFGNLVANVVGLMVGRSILMREGNTKRYQMVTQEYKERVRALRHQLRDTMARRADHAAGDQVDSTRYRSASGAGGRIY